MDTGSARHAGALALTHTHMSQGEKLVHSKGSRYWILGASLEEGIRGGGESGKPLEVFMPEYEL